MTAQVPPLVITWDTSPACETTLSDFLAELADLRVQLGLTQAQVGKHMGVDRRRVAKIENNDGNISVGEVTQYVRALGGRMTATVVHPDDTAEEARP